MVIQNDVQNDVENIHSETWDPNVIINKRKIFTIKKLSTAVRNCQAIFPIPTFAARKTSGTFLAYVQTHMTPENRLVG
jgi:hypothetical protein